MLKPVATSVAFGLMFATVLVLVLIPCLFGLLPERRPITEEAEAPAEN